MISTGLRTGRLVHGTRCLSALKFLFIFFTFFYFSVQATHAQISTRKLEAIYLYNFTKYIDWHRTHEVFVIGVLRDTHIATELSENLKGKEINNTPIQFKTISSLSDATHCQILYLPKSESRDLNALLQTISNKNVLLVSEEDLAARGASVSFFTDGSKLRFKINQQALDKAGLKASSSLLGLAIVI